MQWPLLIAAAFLAGSIPFGLIIGRARGIDIRQHGSKNIGATNVWRVLGRGPGLLCFVLDVLKGLGPTLSAGLAGGLIHGRLLDAPISPRDAWLWIAVMAAGILGHMFSPWVGFKGGKGVATAMGSALGVFPYLTIPAVAAFVVWIAVLRASGFVSLASIIAVNLLPLGVLAWAVLSSWAAADHADFASLYPFYTVTTALAVMVVYRHRANIARLRAGTENRIGGPRPPPQPPAP